MMVLPGWGSADAASWWSGFYFWVGLGAFLIVGFSAVLSYRYGARKDELFVFALNQKVLAYRTEENGFQLRLAAAEKRHLTETQRRTLVAALAEFAGQKVRFKAVAGDAEAQGLRDDFVAVMSSAKWSFDANADVLQGSFQPPPTGVQVTMNETDAQEGIVPDAIKALVAALHILGITPENTIFTSADVPRGTIDVVVGRR
jgi:hypothetical protein